MRSSRVNLLNRYCHLIGRIAHRAFFLDDDERTRLADGSPALSRVSATRTRLTGLGAADGPGGVLVAETRASTRADTRPSRAPALTARRTR